MTSTPPEGTQQQAQQAGQQAAQEVQQQTRNANDLTPQDLLNSIDSLPDKIVEAIKSVYPGQQGSGGQQSGQQSSGQQQDQGQQQSAQQSTQQSEPGGPWFGHKTFGDFWFGNKS